MKAKMSCYEIRRYNFREKMKLLMSPDVPKWESRQRQRHRSGSCFGMLFDPAVQQCCWCAQSVKLKASVAWEIYVFDKGDLISNQPRDYRYSHYLFTSSNLELVCYFLSQFSEAMRRRGHSHLNLTKRMLLNALSSSVGLSLNDVRSLKVIQ